MLVFSGLECSDVGGRQDDGTPVTPQMLPTVRCLPRLFLHPTNYNVTMQRTIEVLYIQRHDTVDWTGLHLGMITSSSSGSDNELND